MVRQKYPGEDRVKERLIITLKVFFSEVCISKLLSHQLIIKGFDLKWSKNTFCVCKRDLTGE